VPLNDFGMQLEMGHIFPNGSRDFLYLRMGYQWLVEHQVVSQAQFSIEDMLSNIGGLLNLYLGVSLFAMIQIPILLAVKLFGSKNGT